MNILVIPSIAPIIIVKYDRKAIIVPVSVRPESALCAPIRTISVRPTFKTSVVVGFVIAMSIPTRLSSSDSDAFASENRLRSCSDFDSALIILTPVAFSCTTLTSLSKNAWHFV